ncbi:glycosyltransferase family 2 protein [Lentisphaera marina]|uniref:glycosyltransferase family 2 protein n=1 Tax=Lentisphaera marina TaxID=1111041 RepID=UPI002365814D|nr:glycosyltransferase family 2 protein [Lentisphaera marina]MDD7986805.1 glycosyltransferase family 2 protein [Lentisphaera marina]
MAFMPWFTVTPTTLICIAGYIRNAKYTQSVTSERYKTAVVDVLIPAYNEERNILLCLESLHEQNFKFRKVLLIDDHSDDRTVEIAKGFSRDVGMELEVMVRETHVGKTPAVKYEARVSDADVEFVLDGDTVLSSKFYLERVIQELYKYDDVASSCGVVLPESFRKRKKYLSEEHVAKYSLDHHVQGEMSVGVIHHASRFISNCYRKVMCLFLQRFIYQAEMNYCGSIVNPIGCAVAYKRKYLKEIFNEYEPILGDDLTDSEDIFLGFALAEEGYRNVHVSDVEARTLEPELQDVPKQVMMWSSSFLQSCYYFDNLLYSIFKFAKRHPLKGKREPKLDDTAHGDEGHEYTHLYGRDIGVIIFTGLCEKLAFPIVFLVLIFGQMWEPLVLTMLGEALISTTILVFCIKRKRLKMFFEALLITPIRYLVMLFDIVVMFRFAKDIWIGKERHWRK